MFIMFFFYHFIIWVKSSDIISHDSFAEYLQMCTDNISFLSTKTVIYLPQHDFQFNGYVQATRGT